MKLIRSKRLVSKEQINFEFKLFFGYCLIFYYLPFALFMLTGNPLEKYFGSRPSYTAGIIYVVFCAIIFVATHRFSRYEIKFKNSYFGNYFFGVNASVFWATCFLMISVWSAIALGSTFRQVGLALSEVGPLGYLLTVGKMYAGVAILVHYRCVVENSNYSKRSLALLLICFGFTINVQAAVDVVLAVGAFVAATHVLRRKMPINRTFIKRASIGLAPILVLFVFIVGKSNKIGLDATLEIVTNFELLAEEFTLRAGYHFYSVSTHVEKNLFNFSLTLEAIKEVMSVMQFRLGSLLGLDVERPVLGTIARMNFMNFAEFYVERIGTSPSMLGSLFYFPGAGLAILYYTFVIRFILHLFWRIMGDTQNSWLFMLVSIVIMTAAVDSTLDALNPLSVGFTRILFLILGGNFIVLQLRKRNAPSRLKSRRI